MGNGKTKICVRVRCRVNWKAACHELSIKLFSIVDEG